jgi:hypothetical protein
MSRRFFRRSGAALAGLTLCGGLTAGTLAATASPAGAQSYILLQAESSGLDLNVSGASTAPGGVVIQWPATGGGLNEMWTVPATGSGGVIQNANSAMCLTTDGVAGDQLYQKPCIRRLRRYETWDIYNGDPGDVVIYNPYFNLVVDVYGDSDSWGAPIDAWPYNGQGNQNFTEVSIPQAH